jgi:EAL domain-containing protein (putative c-di-GMP-specific phosphodiesterase class I)/GGDEF domain-containing protein
MPEHARSPLAWRRGLAARFTLFAGALLAALAALVIGLTSLDARDAAAQRIRHQAIVEAAQAAGALSAGGDSASLLATLKSEPGVSYAVLLDADGVTLAGDRPAEAPPATGALARDVSAYAAVVSGDGRIVHVAKSVTLPDGSHAMLRLGRSLSPATAAADSALARGLIVSLAFMALALPAVAFASDRAVAPLRALARAKGREVAADGMFERAAGRGDEIGALARAHLAMTRDLAGAADAARRLTLDDPLTQLPNAEGLRRRLAAALDVGETAALLMVRMDGLGRIEAGLGRAVSEAAACAAAQRLTSAAEEWTRRAGSLASLGHESRAIVARVSEDGFAFLAHGAEASGSNELARLALQAFETPLTLGEHRVTLGLRIGVALGPTDGADADALRRSVAVALGAAAPGEVRFARPELNDRAYGRLRIEQELRRAIEQGELEVHYQPQIALDRGLVVGAEALVRWRHPTRGLIAPGEFIPVAEETGLVEPLGRFVLGEASRQTAAWAEMGMAIRIAVNVSALQFRAPNFGEATLALIREAGADPAAIELEITESTAMIDAAHAARELRPLKAAGVRIAIDDFGTGYSNLATLTRLPFDVLKIDRGFIRDALDQPSARVVVGAVLGLAASLGVETVAEGVETDDQLRFVTEHGCTYGQGYLFGKPMPAAMFQAWRAARLGADLRAISAAASQSPRGRLAG